jgi:tRNA/rRNA methyltransferase
VLTPEQLDHIVVILVRARNPNNIGAAARAMHDFGIRHLRIVNDYAPSFETARSAVDASEILTSATTHTSLAEAIRDCTLVVGTTAVGERALEHSLHPLSEAAALITAESLAPGSPRIALLFGSEKTGLSNEELSHCHWLLTIPMQQHEDLRHPSMNLGQAVAVCLYEITRGIPLHVVPRNFAPATAEEIDRLLAVFTPALEATGYTRRHPSNSSPEQFRRLILRMNLTAEDVPVWMGILRQVLRSARGYQAESSRDSQ